jgi:hypothetical protein
MEYEQLLVKLYVYKLIGPVKFRCTINARSVELYEDDLNLAYTYAWIRLLYGMQLLCNCVYINKKTCVISFLRHFDQDFRNGSAENSLCLFDITDQ